MIDSFYYVTAGSGEKFLRRYTQYALKSLSRTGVSWDDIYLIVKEKTDKRIIRSLVPGIKNLYRIQEDLTVVKWRKWKNIRKYSLFKAAALYKAFSQPMEERCMIYFDGDVLWYKNPRPFLATKSKKTWFHHGKDLHKRASIPKDKVDITNFKSLSKWCAMPQAHLMTKWGAKQLPDREVVAGLYMLHPRDHADVLRVTYEGCLENADKFVDHEGVGDQKPMNAALSIVGVDWHGGSRFFCPEHQEYFDHFFGKQNMKRKFDKRAKDMGL